MSGPSSPEPEHYQVNASIRAALFADIDRLLLFILLVAFLTPALIAASIVAPPIFSRWFLSTSPWIVWPLLGTATFAMAWLARWFRDVRKSEYYALLEMPVGVALALQGVVQQGLMLSQRATFVVALIAFVAGLRITTDGWKRFYDNDTRSLFSLQHLLRALRKS